MRVRFFSEYSNVATPAALLIAARIANMVLGLAVIPVLLAFLGTEHFAAWALLLALGAAFSLLELSMPPTYVRAVAPLIHAGRTREARQVTANALCIVFLSFGIAGVPLIAAASVLVKAVGLPDGQLLSAAELVVFVFIAASLRALLQFGSLRLNAARKFGALAASSFLQSFSSNLAAALAAIITGTLEYAVIAFWVAQLLALTAVGIAARIALPEGDTERDSEHVGRSRNVMRDLLKHALPLQVYDWAQVVSYQFDKFVIAAISGLPSVALYEVGNRSVLALRSIPASGIDSFLATASIGQTDRDALWNEYVRITKLAFVAVVVFILAPLAVAPFLLYAWVGDVGYQARWVFACLAFGAAASLVALPAAAMLQALGRPDLQARAAIVSLALNIPLSLTLALGFGPVGASVATALAMTLGAVLTLSHAHRAYRRDFSVRFSPNLGWKIRNAAMLGVIATTFWVTAQWWQSGPASHVSDASSRAIAAVYAAVGCSFIAALLLLVLKQRNLDPIWSWRRARKESPRPKESRE